MEFEIWAENIVSHVQIRKLSGEQRDAKLLTGLGNWKLEAARNDVLYFLLLCITSIGRSVSSGDRRMSRFAICISEDIRVRPCCSYSW